jgi:hypothetical protein
MRSHAPAFAVVAFFALLLRVLLPQGMMLSHDASGVVMTLCSGVSDAQSQIVVDLRHGKKPAGDHQQPCDFAVASAAAVHSVGPAVAPPFAIPLLIVSAPLAGVAIGRGLAAPPPPSTGPPAVA